MSIAGGSGGDRPQRDGRDGERDRKDAPARRYDDRGGGRGGAPGGRGPRAGDSRTGRPARERNDRDRPDRDRADRGRSDRYRDDRGGDSRPGGDRVGGGWADRPRTDRPRTDGPRTDRPRTDRPRTDRPTGFRDDRSTGYRAGSRDGGRPGGDRDSRFRADDRGGRDDRPRRDDRGSSTGRPAWNRDDRDRPRGSGDDRRPFRSSDDGGRGFDRDARRGPSDDKRRDERPGGYRGRNGDRDDRGTTGRAYDGPRRDDRDSSGDRSSGYAGRGSGSGYPSRDDRARRERTDDRPAYGDRPSGGGRNGYDRSSRDERGSGFRSRASGEQGSYRPSDRSASGPRDGKPAFRGRDDRPSTGFRRDDRDDRRGPDRGEQGGYRRPDRDDRSGGRRDDRGTASGGERSTYRRDDRPAERSADRGRPERGSYNRDRSAGDRPGYRREDRAGYRRDDRSASPRDEASRDEAGSDTGTRDDRRSSERPGYRVWDHERPQARRTGGYRSEDRDRRPAGRNDIDTSRVPEPALPDDVTASELDAEVRRDLRGLQKDTAETVARHLVAAGSLVDDDPEQALAHARYARLRASRIAAVREAAGIAAYHAGEWTEALGELRAARRMGGGPGHLAVMADIERALGRPERAIELTRGPEVGELDRAQTIELAIVAAGARRDLGELDAAVVGLQLPELDPARRDPWSPRLFYAYADNLLAAGRTAEAVEWFVRATDVDEDSSTDAAARLAKLTGDPEPDDAEDDVEFVEQAEQEPDAPVAEESADEEPVIEVEVVEAEAVEAEAVEEPVVEAPDEVPSSVADPVSDDTAGSDVAEGPR